MYTVHEYIFKKKKKTKIFKHFWIYIESQASTIEIVHFSHEIHIISLKWYKKKYDQTDIAAESSGPTWKFDE